MDNIFTNKNYLWHSDHGMRSTTCKNDVKQSNTNSSSINTKLVAFLDCGSNKQTAKATKQVSARPPINFLKKIETRSIMFKQMFEYTLNIGLG